MEQSRENAESSFAEAFEASLNFKKPEQGEMLRGVIVSISGEDAYIAYGGPTEAVMATAELEGREVGDSIEATVVQTSPDVRISRKMMARKASLEAIRQAYENRVPVEAKVTGRNKGGFDVTVAGSRAFCPLSQITLGKIENPDTFLNQTFEFLITEFSDDGRKFVVSRASLMKEEAAARAQETRRAIVPGAILEGKVKTIMPFGAFVDLGGVEGLVHVSEMSRRRVHDPKEIVTQGQDVTVKVIKVDQEGKRISLSMKDMEPDPWQGIEERYPVGAPFTGKIVRAADFGVFIELEPGIDGLVHVSQFPLGVKAGDAGIAPETVVTGWIREVDANRRRVSLALREFAVTDPWAEAEAKFPVGRVVEGTVERASGPGVFIQLEPGLTGLVPGSELGLPPGSDAAKVYRSGATIKVKIMNVDIARRRITLSVEGAKDAASHTEFLEYQKRNVVETNEGKSALALALEKALEGRK
jgi:small subunit ribosomal protein S1